MTEFGMAVLPNKGFREAPQAPYRPPMPINTISLRDLLAKTGRQGLQDKQYDLLRSSGRDAAAYYAGDIDLLSRSCVSVVGKREASKEGVLRARRLARELVAANIVVVSGLARGIDTAALTSAIENRGAVVAVIGTPLDKVYPPENAALQQEISARHLLLSPFKIGDVVQRKNFPKRNRVMAALSDATVIVEAADNSGTLHQAVECDRLGRWLFILRAVVEDPKVQWPSRFLKGKRTRILDRTEQIIDALKTG